MNCGICQAQDFRRLFSKDSEKGQCFEIMVCRQCNTMQTLPRPGAAELAACYQDSYFEQRTERGYANYRSESVRSQIERVFQMNLNDLGFFAIEPDLLQSGGRSLDVGCAAGYFVQFMKDRGWQSCGVEVSKSMADYARGQGLQVIHSDFLTDDFNHQSYDFVTLWASIEHFAEPRLVAERLSKLVRQGGALVVSTCRRGLLSWLQGPSWRYMNVPEHLFFFSKQGLIRLFAGYGFRYVQSVSYGSGLTTRPGASVLYRLAKRIADPLVKLTDQGDMIAVRFERL